MKTYLRDQMHKFFLKLILDWKFINSCCFIFVLAFFINFRIVPKLLPFFCFVSSFFFFFAFLSSSPNYLLVIIKDSSVDPFVMLCAIWYYLCNLRKAKNTHGRVYYFIKSALWVFFTFSKFYKWYQIAQSISFIHMFFY